MITFKRADTLHRLVKEALDSGAASTVEEAESTYRSYRVSLAVDAFNARTPAGQAALLTAVALARRVFLGGVQVAGPVDVPLVTPMPFGSTLRSALVALGGAVVLSVDPLTPLVTIGNIPTPAGNPFHMRMSFSGWSGGVVPADHDAPCESGALPLAAMLAAALSVSETFAFLRGEGGAVGRRPVGLSLWRPGVLDWTAASAPDEPQLRFLPTQLWLMGLGHLGQAYLWALGLLPYADPTCLRLVLQDVDIITPSTESTSILTDAVLVGRKKTRAMAEWAERRGFSTSLHERLFDGVFRRQECEPSIVLCGVDNALARSVLDTVGFPFVVEAGLGRGYTDFRSIRLHTLPSSRPASELWKTGIAESAPIDQPAYRTMLAGGELDRCGVTVLAGKAVGAPFVGAVAACLAVSEVLRLLHGGAVHQVISVDLQSLEHRDVLMQRVDFSGLNPGYTSVRGA